MAGLNAASAADVPPRRLLFVLQSVAVGGMETQCAELVAQFVQLGLRVAVALPVSRVFAGFGEQLVAVGAQVEWFQTDARSGRAAQVLGMLRMIRFMHAWRPDVVHVHTGGVTGGIAMLAAARLGTDATVVLTEHDVPVADPGARLRLATAVKDRCLHALIALSARNADLRRRRLGVPERKFVGIRPGVRVQRTAPDGPLRLTIRAPFAIPQSAAVIGCVVRLAAGKGLDDLVRAFALVVRDEPCDLLLVGDGPLRGSLEALVRDLGLTERVHFAGYQSQPGNFLDAMDIFVLAAPVGSGSIALLEAMARSIPAVISYCGPGEFLLANVTGLCAEARDHRSLAVALLRLVRDPGMRQVFGAAALQRVRRDFRIENVALDLLEVYQTAQARAIPERLKASQLAGHG